MLGAVFSAMCTWKELAAGSPRTGMMPFYHHGILPVQQLVCCSVRSSPLLLMWFPLGRCPLIHWEGAGAPQDTQKSPYWRGSLCTSAALHLGTHPAWGTITGGCWSSWLIAGGPATLWSAFISLHVKKGNGLTSQPPLQGLWVPCPSCLSPGTSHGEGCLGHITGAAPSVLRDTQLVTEAAVQVPGENSRPNTASHPTWCPAPRQQPLSVMYLTQKTAKK